MSAEPTGEATTALVYIPDHAARNVRRLLTQDRDRPRLVALVEALGMGAQELEDVHFDLLLGRALDAATGHTLDLWGGIVGEARGALTRDPDYRRFIQARILANVSKGTIDDVLGVWSAITAPSTVRYVPMHPAGFKLYAVRQSWLSRRMARRVARMMEDVRPAGVSMALIEALTGYYGFEDNRDAYGFNRGKLARVLT